MAIPLVYKSCLTDEALADAVTNYAEVTEKREEQDKARAEHEEKQNNEAEQA